jgi:hypothetical protein
MGYVGCKMIRTHLTQDVNTLNFMKGNNYAELDEMGIFLEA